jgi:hypothetical protein
MNYLYIDRHGLKYDYKNSTLIDTDSKTATLATPRGRKRLDTVNGRLINMTMVKENEIQESNK